MQTKKVVIEIEVGFFSLSDKALSLFKSKKGLDPDWQIFAFDIVRWDPCLIEVIEELGEDAKDSESSEFTVFEIVEIAHGRKFIIRCSDMAGEYIQYEDQVDWHVF